MPYYAEEINFVEYREGRGIVALIAITGRLKNENHMNNSKSMIWDRTPIEREILQSISNAIKVPAYFVIYTEDLSLFHIYTLPDIINFKRMNSVEYGDFIKGL